MHIYIMGFSGDINLFVRTICAASILLITRIAALVLNTINIVIYITLADLEAANPDHLILGFVITGVLEFLLILEVVFDVFLFIGLYKKKMVAYKVFKPSVICYIFETITYVYLMPMISFKFTVIPYMALDIFLVIINIAQLLLSAVLLVYIGSYHANVRDKKVEPPYISSDTKFVNDFYMWTNNEDQDSDSESEERPPLRQSFSLQYNEMYRFKISESNSDDSS